MEVAPEARLGASAAAQVGISASLDLLAASKNLLKL